MVRLLSPVGGSLLRSSSSMRCLLVLMSLRPAEEVSMSDRPLRAFCVGGPHHGEYLPTFDSEQVIIPKDAEIPAWDLTGPLAHRIGRGVYQLRQIQVGRYPDKEFEWLLIWQGWVD